METIAQNREDGGRLLRQYWLEWACRHPNPKPSWLLSWEQMAESDKEADRYMWDHLIAPYSSAIDELVAVRTSMFSMGQRMIDRIEQLEQELEAAQKKVVSLEIQMALMEQLITWEEDRK